MEIPPLPDPEKSRPTLSPLLFIIIAAIIVGMILAFLIIRPNPRSAIPNPQKQKGVSMVESTFFVGSESARV